MELAVPDPGLLLLFGQAARVADQLPEEARVRLGALRAQMAWAGPEDDERVEAVAEAIVDARLRRARLTAVEGVSSAALAEALATVARRRHLPLVAVHVDGAGATAEGRRTAERALARLRKRKGAAIHALQTPDAEAATLRRTPHASDRRDEQPPFDVIGDVHGCRRELELLLEALGYVPDAQGVWGSNERRAVFLGDLVDRGPDCVGTFELVRRMVEAGRAFCVLGNHDAKFLRWLEGRKVKVTHGLQRTVAEVEALPADEQAAFRERAQAFLRGLPSHLRLDGGRLVVAHAGIREDLIGRTGKTVEAFTCYGDTTGKLDAHGLPERGDWAADYTGEALILYGHTPTPRAWVRNNTACIDQGCVFGGGLTAFLHPEGVFATAAARRTYVPPRGGFRPRVLPPPLEPDLPLDPS